jgi:hypothetical protein
MIAHNKDKNAKGKKTIDVINPNVIDEKMIM